MRAWPSTLVALILGGALVASGYLLAGGIKSLHANARHVVVKGLAERDVRANRAELTIFIQNGGPDRAATFPAVDAAQKRVVEALKALGFKDSEITSGQWLTEAERSEFTPEELNANPKLARHAFTTKSTVHVETNSVDQAAAAERGVNDLITRTQGAVTGAAVAYAYTELRSIRGEMIAEATHDARNAAQQFAKDSGSKVGVIREASQGVFSVTDKGAHASASADRPADEGAAAGSSLEKSVRVVTSVDYELID